MALLSKDALLPEEIYKSGNFRLTCPFGRRPVSAQLNSIGQTMNATKDSLQQGIAAYTRKDYRNALRLFDWNRIGGGMAEASLENLVL